MTKRPNNPSVELPIQQKTYAAVLELVQTVEKMPRSHRFVLGDRIVNLGYDLVELVTIIVRRDFGLGLVSGLVKVSVIT